MNINQGVFVILVTEQNAFCLLRFWTRFVLLEIRVEFMRGFAVRCSDLDKLNFFLAIWPCWNRNGGPNPFWIRNWIFMHLRFDKRLRSNLKNHPKSYIYKLKCNFINILATLWIGFVLFRLGLNFPQPFFRGE